MEQEYLQELKNSVGRGIKKQPVEEGFLRGVYTDVKHAQHAFTSVGDLFHLRKAKILPRVKKVLSKTKQTVQKMDFTPPKGRSPILSNAQMQDNWRFYYFTNDKIFKTCMDKAKKGQDPIKFFDLSFRDKVANELYASKSTNDVLKFIDKFEKRVEMVHKAAEKDPDNSSWLNFLKQAIYGLRDFVIAVERFVAYN